MIDGRPWIALYSHTGSEIRNISKKLGYQPDLIVTNNIRPQLLWKQCVATTRKPSVQDYRSILNRYKYTGDNPIITLHGWMRIVPPEICDEYNIFNLHPGLITEYPALKGKDPQQRVFEMLNTPQYVGCVIHRATSVLDDGPVIMSRRVLNTYPNANTLTDVLHTMASDMWIDFINKRLYI